MTTSPSILNKVKLLLGLAKSPNPHEAESARNLAQGLIEKHGITPEEIEALNPKPLYGDDDKVFVTLGVVGWMQQLCLCVGNYFECQIVQVELVPNEGPHPFEYYAYGEPESVKAVKSNFQLLLGKVEALLSNKVGRGDIYRTSYAEGVVAAIKENISFYGLEIPEIPQTKLKVEKTTEAAIEPQKKERPKAAERRVDVNGQSVIGDIGAYFNGLYDGRDISFDDWLNYEPMNRIGE